MPRLTWPPRIDRTTVAALLIGFTLGAGSVLSFLFPIQVTAIATLVMALGTLGLVAVAVVGLPWRPTDDVDTGRPDVSPPLVRSGDAREEEAAPPARGAQVDVHERELPHPEAGP